MACLLSYTGTLLSDQQHGQDNGQLLRGYFSVKNKTSPFVFYFQFNLSSVVLYNYLYAGCMVHNYLYNTKLVHYYLLYYYLNYYLTVFGGHGMEPCES